MRSPAFDSGMAKAVESARTKRASASPSGSAKKRERSAAERFPARELAKTAIAAPFPDSIEPCLAALASEVPEGDRWLHEIKWDGYRLHLRVENGRVRLLTRRGLDWTHRFPPIAAAAAKLPVRTAYLDGEAIVEHRGIADFGALQQELAAGAAHNALLFAFDLLYLDGQDLRREPLIQRKGLLSFAGQPHSFGIRYSEHLLSDGQAMHRQARAMGLEGIVSKRRDCPYRSGRSEDWLKVKSAHRQEFVIAGYAPHTNSTRSVGSLILGEYRGGKLTHVGRAGTGFTDRTARDVWQKLHPLEMSKAPFAGGRPSGYVARNLAKWVEPKLVAEIEFRAWTTDRQLRHASFKGLREDKAAEEVIAEETPPAPSNEPYSAVHTTALRSAPARKPATVRKGAAAALAKNIQRVLPYAVHTASQEVTLPPTGAAWRRMPYLISAAALSPSCVTSTGSRSSTKGCSHRCRLPSTSSECARADGERGTRLWIDSIEGLLGSWRSAQLSSIPGARQSTTIERPDTLALRPGSRREGR